MENPDKSAVELSRDLRHQLDLEVVSRDASVSSRRENFDQKNGYPGTD